ncbi:ArsA family ATPase [Bacillus sp. SM2101]|uniref:ArsA family ATPase n=1 Tax=Bacillus sp. SM2101 TaxID=2805366 RepID=UPI001BDEBFB6|nr:ArsA family ATPase [Bacillus sp. SM2101]
MDIKKILFVGGKGGVGKSTTAAAIALKLAKNNKRTLIISTDPAHNIGDIFHQQVGHTQREVYSNLFALEIDPHQEADRYIQTVKDNIRETVKPHMLEEVNRQIDLAKCSPGADEAALFDKLVSIIIEKKDKFDHLIIDTAPTGHTLRLLSLPELMTVWMNGMVSRRKKINRNYSQLLNDGEEIEDPIYKILKMRKNRFKEVRDILLNSKVTGYLFVLNAERLPIIETKKAVMLLQDNDFQVETIVVNKVLPDDMSDTFFQQRKQQERVYLDQIKEQFKSQKVMLIPLFNEDIHSFRMLSNFAEQI